MEEKTEHQKNIEEGIKKKRWKNILRYTIVILIIVVFIGSMFLTYNSNPVAHNISNMNLTNVTI